MGSCFSCCSSSPSSSLPDTFYMTDAERETYAEKKAYAEMLEEKLQSRMIKIALYDQCVLIEIAATLALNLGFGAIQDVGRRPIFDENLG